jgi:sugar-specific transcriptional regulator TrmB
MKTMEDGNLMELDDIINSLREFGMGEYEIKTYLALLERGKTQARTLSSLTRIPYTKIYQVLQVLESYGFVILSFGKPRMYVPVSPELALTKRMEQIREEARVIEEKRSSLKKSLIEELLPLYQASVGEEDDVLMTEKEFWKVTGTINVISIANEMIESATKLRITTPDPKNLMELVGEKLTSRDNQELLVRTPLPRLMSFGVVYFFPNYNGVDFLIQDNTKAMSIYPSGGTSKFTYGVYSAGIWTHPQVINSLICDFDLSLTKLDKFRG